ncbi:hypothetical protein [Halostagnicola kamekurae]|nr:hypothetical protein [Halostagnicola kamekurae]
MDPDDLFDVISKVALPFAVGAVGMTAVNVTLLYLLPILFPSVSFNALRICIQPVLAAIQEPIISKYLPAVFIVWLARRYEWTENLISQRYQYGLVGGLTVGALEWASKSLGDQSLSFIELAPILMHTVNGLLIGIGVFRIAGKEGQLQDYIILTIAVVLAVLTHLFWNIRVAFWVTDLPPCLMV